MAAGGILGRRYDCYAGIGRAGEQDAWRGQGRELNADDANRFKGSGLGLGIGLGTRNAGAGWLLLL